MRKTTVLVGGVALVGLLSGCGLLGGGGIKLTITNLRAPTVACEKDASDNKPYMTLNFDYVGTVSAMKVGLTPYGAGAPKPAEYVTIANVNTPPTGVRLPFPSSNTITVKLNLAEVAVTPQGVSPQAVTQPDPKTSYPMNVTLSASNTSGEKAGPLTLNGVDVGGCYSTTAQ